MLEGRLDPEHELVCAAKLIDWDGLHDALSSHYSRRGRSGKPIRLMVGIHVLKHRYSCSDERAVEELQENVYWQYFCGFKTLQTKAIMDPTSLVKFRNRIGTDGMKLVEEAVTRAWGEQGLVKTKRVLVDTASQPKNIACSTAVDLLRKVREKITKKAKEVSEKEAIRRTYRSVEGTGKKVLLYVKKLYRNKRSNR
jgi:IS5 family transposase